MQYILAGLAVVAAVAALIFRPPHEDPAAAHLGISTQLAAAGQAPNAGPSAAAGRESSAWREVAGGRQATAAGGAHDVSAARPRVVVYVAGEVVDPGVYELTAGARVQAALARAGGAKPDADLVAVNLAAAVEDGTEIVFPKIGQAAPRPGRSSRPRLSSGKAPRGHGRARHAKPRAAPSHSVDLNSADMSELQTLPGLGPALAARIVAYRDANGPFASVDELADVAGVTPRLQEEIADFIVIR